MRYYKTSVALILLLGIAIIIAAQFSIPTLFDADGYLHIRMAKFIQQYGPRYNFHWARYSIFNYKFADKDFLYHLLLIPFSTFPDMFLGIKVATCLFSLFLYLVFFFLLRRYCQIKPLILAFLVVFFSSSAFLHALCRARNMIFVIGLTLLYAHFLIKKRQWWLFAVTAIYALTHVSSHFLLIFAILCEAVRFFSEGKFFWKNIRSVALGLLVGCLLHPNFPNNLLYMYLNGVLVPIFALKWGLELGAEFFPIDTRTFVLSYPFIFIGLILLVAAALTRVSQIKTATRIWMAMAGFFFIFSFFSQRYLIHAYPLILLALASYFSDWWQASGRMLWLKQQRLLKAGLLFVACLIFIAVGFQSYAGFRQRALAEEVYNRHYEAIGNWMSHNIPPGEVVFHANWSDSQYFIGLNPQDDYFVTLDPIYMYYWNPQKYNLYREIAFGSNPDPYTALKNEFAVRYGYVGKNYFSGLIYQIRPDERFEVLAEDNLGLIFRLK